MSVVILTRNSAETIEKCLKSVIQERPGEILAVDTLSTDETLAILKSYGAKVLSDTSFSLGNSRQLGLEAATGPYVMFVDSDTNLDDGCIMKLRSDLEGFGWVGVHAKILSQENVSYWQRAEDEMFSLFYNRIGPKAGIACSAALFRRQVLLRFGFDPYFDESCEDRDLCLRLRKNGLRVGVSVAVARHLHRRSFPAFAKQRFRYGLGDARLAVKYRSIQILFASLKWTFLQIMYSLARRRVSLIPHSVTGGVLQFLGLAVGFPRALQAMHNMPKRSTPNTSS